jgi:hypothetical protein
VVAGESRGKDDRKQNTLYPLELSIELNRHRSFLLGTIANAFPEKVKGKGLKFPMMIIASCSCCYLINVNIIPLPDNFPLFPSINQTALHFSNILYTKSYMENG